MRRQRDGDFALAPRIRIVARRTLPDGSLLLAASTMTAGSHTRPMAAKSALYQPQ